MWYISVQMSKLQCSLQYECGEWGWGGCYIRSLHGEISVLAVQTDPPRPVGSYCAKAQLIKSISHTHMFFFNGRISYNCLTGPWRGLLQCFSLYGAIYKHVSII